MEFVLCPVMDLTYLTSVARDVCPFPEYNPPSPLLVNMLSSNASLHLRNHYAAVQSSLTPEQLDRFTRGLRSTFGRDGNVTLGGVGVVALSLAVLFDTLARQVRGEQVLESGPIPGLFVKDLRGYYPPQVGTISQYLRLIPHIANNPQRMKEETQRCHQRLAAEDQELGKLGGNHSLPIQEDVTAFNLLLSYIFEVSLGVHYRRIKNAADDELEIPDRRPPKDIIFSFNCDPETANAAFKAEVQKFDEHTQKKVRGLLPHVSSIGLQEVARLEFFNEMMKLSCAFADTDSMAAQREGFDLKSNGLRTWRQLSR